MTYEPSALIGCSRRISVSIKGFCDFVLKKGESHTVELDDGEYTIVLRGYFTKRRIVLTLQGDDSFYVTWDYNTGGIIICDRMYGSVSLYPKSRSWFTKPVYLALLSYIAIFVLSEAGIGLHAMGWMTIIAGGVAAATLGVIMALNSLPITRARSFKQEPTRPFLFHGDVDGRRTIKVGFIRQILYSLCFYPPIV